MKSLKTIGLAVALLVAGSQVEAGVWSNVGTFVKKYKKGLILIGSAAAVAAAYGIYKICRSKKQKRLENEKILEMEGLDQDIAKEMAEIKKEKENPYLRTKVLIPILLSKAIKEEKEKALLAANREKEAKKNPVNNFVLNAVGL